MTEFKPSNLTILYVEDDAETRQELSIFLRRRVGRLILAADGNEGLDLFRDHQPDIVIADLLMPGMHGIKMLEEMRRLAPDCRFIITSSVNETDTLLEAIDVGIVKYIVKPIDLQQLDYLLRQIGEELGAKPGRDNLPAERRRLMEAELRKQATQFLKQHSGKGPRDTAVFLRDNCVDILFYDVLSPLEKTLLTHPAGRTVIEQSRRYFYLACQQELEALLAGLGIPAALSEILIQPHRGADKLTFLRK